MASTPGGGVLADVQRQLAAGWGDEDILAALTAKGLSRGSAERFLQRARPAGAAPPPVPIAPPPVPAAAAPYEAAPAYAEIAPPPLPSDAPTVVFAAPVPAAEAATVVFEPPAMPMPAPPPVPEPAPRPVAASVDPADAPGTGSRLGVIGGSVVMTLGLVFLAWALGQERVRLRLPLAITFGGAAWMFSAARALIDLRRPATWVLPGSAAALPAVAAIAVLGAVLATGAPKAPRDGEIASRVPERRAAGPSDAKATQAKAIATFVEQLHDPRAGDPCQAAQRLAAIGAREAVPNLMQFLEAATEHDRKVCAAHALSMLGEGSAMLPVYLEWLESDSDLLVHHAIVGFGHIGPSAAHEAVPALQAALDDSPSEARRWVIVSTLAKLGPAAAPALQMLVDDDNANVRTAAQKALEKLR
jgi:hypothetical protein